VTGRALSGLAVPVFFWVLLAGTVADVPVARAQGYIPDLVCPAVGGRSPARRPPSPEEEVVPFDIDALDHTLEPPPDADPQLASQFRPGVAGVRGPGIRRLAIWGDSHIASGVFGDELKRILGLGGIDTGNAFIPPYMARRGVRVPVRAFCVGSAWSLSMA
jgi:hypothetical protein